MSIPAPNPPYLGPASFCGGKGNMPIHRIVVHCTVSPCIKGGARGVAAYFRGKSAGGSAHYVVDPYESVQVVWDSVVAYHAPPNANSLGVELCDPMTGTAKRWGGKNHKLMLDRAAELVAQLCLAYDVPITRLTVDDLKAGRHGICGHVDVSQAFHQSTHYDPGDGFPWDHFLQLVRQHANALHFTPKPAPPVPRPNFEAIDKAAAAGIKGNPAGSRPRKALRKVRDLIKPWVRPGK